MAETCGDCVRGQCHGADPDDCGCRLHDTSVAAANAKPVLAGHGPGAPRHGYDGTCREEWDCDNRTCARKLPHAVCTEACTEPLTDEQAEALRAARAAWEAWDPADQCDPATGHHSTPHKGCILR